jgi:hypothetical protein
VADWFPKRTGRWATGIFNSESNLGPIRPADSAVYRAAFRLAEFISSHRRTGRNLAGALVDYIS